MKKKSNVYKASTYVAPMIEVHDIVLEQSVLDAGSGTDFEGEPW
jgi:hypothetical protein